MTGDTREDEGTAPYVPDLAEEEQMQCDVPGCEVEPLFHCTRVESRRVVFDKSFCESHAREVVTAIRSTVSAGGGMQGAMCAAASVDLEMIVYYVPRRDTSTPACIYLHEVGGTRRICMVVDGWAWFALLTHIKHEPAPRPHTHAAWATTITELGGRLQNVVLDRGEGEDWWSATASIVKDGRLLSVEVRPSDACILALIDNVPIFVVETAIERFCLGSP